MPLDAVLAALYAQVGHAAFATDVAGFALLRHDNATHELEEHNQGWRESWGSQLATPLFVFAGESGLAHSLATVPALADPHGRQPVVWINTYDLDGPYALPVASDVDRFFDTYSRYLEALLSHPDFPEMRSAALTFPWEVTDLLQRDMRLVEMLRAGNFAPLMKKTGSTPAWAAKVLGS